MRWAIEIQKTSLDDRMLSDLLRELKLNLVEGKNFSKAFSGPEIDTCATSHDAIKIARKVRSAFKIAEIDPEFSLGAAIDFSVDPPTSHHFIEADSGVLTISIFPAKFTVFPSTNLSPTEGEQWLKNHEEQQHQLKLNDHLSTLIPAYSNLNAAKVFELLSIEPQTAVNLWKIYELIRNGKKDSIIQEQFGIENNDFLRFKDRIHNASVSGDYARHANDDKPHTDNPMSKSEAEAFINNIAKKWFKTIRREFEKRKV